MHAHSTELFLVKQISTLDHDRFTVHFSQWLLSIGLNALGGEVHEQRQHVVKGDVLGSLEGRGRRRGQQKKEKKKVTFEAICSTQSCIVSGVMKVHKTVNSSEKGRYNLLLYCLSGVIQTCEWIWKN